MSTCTAIAACFDNHAHTRLYYFAYCSYLYAPPARITAGGEVVCE